MSGLSFGIIGAGHVGVGMAVDLESRGHRAVLYATPDHDRILKKMEKQGAIEATESLTGTYSPELTHDVERVIQSSSDIVVTVPSAGHDDIVATLKPFKQQLRSKTLIFITGNGIAPLACHELGLQNAYETARSPYTVRVEEHANDLVKVRINGFKTRMVLAGVQKPSQEVADRIRALFGMPIEWYDNIAQLLLINKHAIVHPATMLRNQDAIRDKRSLFFYKDCMRPEVCDEMLAADAEVAALGRALGVEKKESMLQAFNVDYGKEYTDLYTFVTMTEALNKRPGLPGSMQARQITQDVQIMCVLWASMAKSLGVETPVLDSWINESSEINQQNYWETGRSLERYGLGKRASRDEICAAFGVKTASASYTIDRAIESTPAVMATTRVVAV